jgi:23S rRNA (pseudouridine1915-N3)-methyltransferase
MKIRVLSIGKTNVSFAKDALDEYLQRLKHYCKLEWHELQDVKKVDRKDEALLKLKEGERFLDQIQPNELVFLLDENGKEMSSERFATWLNEQQIYQQQDLVFVIGGAYGFSDSLKQRSNGSISLSKMTFNHQMVRGIFMEQLYRAFTIIKGEPYHHA